MVINRKLSDKLNIWLFVLLAGANLLALNFIIAGWHGARLDLTQYKEHSLSPYTKKVLRELPDRVEIIALFSSNTHNLLKPLIPKLRDILEDYVGESNGKIAVNFLNPKSDKAIENIFEEYAIKPMPVPLKSKYKQEVKSIYFNLVIKYGDQQLKYGIQELVDISGQESELKVKLKNMETLLTRGIKKAVSSFSTIDSALANLTGQIKIIYNTLPDKYKDKIPKEKMKDLEAAQKKLRTIVKGYTSKFKTKVKFIERQAKDESKMFMVTVNYGNKNVEFPLFFNINSVSKSDVGDNLESALKRALPGFSKTIGILDPIPMATKMQMMRMGKRAPKSEFEIVQSILNEQYDVRKVNLDSGKPPVSVEALLIFRPEKLSPQTIYAIDQYIMLGGRVAIFADPSKLDFEALKSGKLKLKAIKSGLEEMISSWGVTIEDKVLLDERNFPYPLPREIQPGLVVVDDVPYPYFEKITNPSGHPMASNLPELDFLWPGFLTIHNVPKELKATTILTSSSKSWSKKLDLKAGLDVTPNRKGMTVPATTKSHTLAVALSGKFTSFYKGKDVAEIVTDKDKKKKALKNKKENKKKDTKLDISSKTKVLVVSDSDFISEIGMKILENRFSFSAKFLLNAVEWLQSDDEDFVTSAKGLPRPLKEMSTSKKITIQHVTWAVSILVLMLIFVTLYFIRRRRRI